MNAQDTIKQIQINADKCIGCRACELACSAFHATPAYGSVNPARSRIRVMIDELKDVYLPVRSGHYTSAECTGRYRYLINGKEYRECGLCRAACPSRDYFKDIETGLPLNCDMCVSDSFQVEPWCVTACGCGALTLLEQEETKEEGTLIPDEIEVELEALVEKHGMERIISAAARMLRA